MDQSNNNQPLKLQFYQEYTINGLKQLCQQLLNQTDEEVNIINIDLISKIRKCCKILVKKRFHRKRQKILDQEVILNNCQLAKNKQEEIDIIKIQLQDNNINKKRKNQIQMDREVTKQLKIGDQLDQRQQQISCDASQLNKFDQQKNLNDHNKSSYDDQKYEEMNQNQQLSQSPIEQNVLEENEEDKTQQTILDQIKLENPMEQINLKYSRNCYICKQFYNQIHHFYHCLCPSCGDFNYQKRIQKCDLSGRVALVTGGRIKIGYQIVLILLRNGATVHVTSRFPIDTVKRYAQEKDYDSWKDRLLIYGLNLIDLMSVKRFCQFLSSSLQRLDIIINNAAQTNRKSRQFYHVQLQVESQNIEMLADNQYPSLNSTIKFKKYLSQPHNLKLEADQSSTSTPDSNNQLMVTNQQCSVESMQNIVLSAIQTQIPLVLEDFEKRDQYEQRLPPGIIDINYQQLDLTNRQSWNKNLDEVEIPEFIETQLINSWAPFIMIKLLKGLMQNSPANVQKFIVNVSSMEGKFNRFKKPTHPHTNMSKASLNMLTKTSSQELVQKKIYMTSVDTGWVSEMQSMNFQFKQSDLSRVPLDEIDGAMRVCDPIFEGIKTGQPKYGVFLKDYTESQW